MMARTASQTLDPVRAAFGSRLQEGVKLANYTTSRTGGPADGLLIANTADELAESARTLWDLNVPFHILGSGSNVLVSDAGVRGVVVINRARNIKIDTHHQTPSVWAESGANLGTVARQVALRGFSGLEWAGTVPGSVGGAVYGNAGAMGGDIASSLILAEILHRESGREAWPVERMAYAYRTSALKRQPRQAVILAARLKLSPSTAETVQASMKIFSEKRRASQPPGASMGSMFKNPPGDYAGRLIEAAGLKGRRIGDAEISTFHANFFINHGQAAAADIYRLIQAARQTVQDKFGIALELEVELLGDWSKADE